MTSPMDHTACSELLPAYVAGSLPAADATAVAAHLEGCADCAAERVAVHALAAVAVEPLSEAERERLRGRVLAELKAEPLAEVIVPRRGWGLGARLAPALGAAAMLALLVVGGVYVSTLSENDSLESAGGGDTLQDREAVPEAAPSDEELATDQGAGGADAGKTTALEAAPGTVRAFDAFSGVLWDGDRGKLTARLLRRIGRDGSAFRAAYNYSTADVAQQRKGALTMLTEAAPADLRDEIDRCADIVFDRDDSALPVYGAVGTFDSGGALVVGFAASPGNGGRLDRYQIWVWGRDDCGRLLYIVSGKIDT